MGDSWVGGDIGGLHNMGATLKAAKDDLDGIVKPLSSGVESLVTDAGWTGDAAQSFRAAWSQDSETAGGFAALVEATGRILSDLADNLATANSALQDAADVATRKGVPVGPTGEPGQLALPQGKLSDQEQQAVSDLKGYADAYKEIMHKAQQARLDAAKSLNDLYDEIHPGKPLGTGDKILVADFLRALWTYKTDKDRKLGLKAAAELPDAQAKHSAALQALKAEEAKFRTDARDIPKAIKLKAEYRAAEAELDKLDAQLSHAASSDHWMPYDRELNFKLVDATHGMKLMDGAPDFLKEIPVVDIAATVAAGGLEAKQDHDEGWSWAHSLATDVGGGLAALGGTTAAAAFLPEELGLGATTVVAGVGLYVGETFDKIGHEHWKEDWHKHGYLAGTLHGTSNVLSGAAKQTVKLISSPLTGVWHGVEDLF